uniref:Cyclin-like domain-containing protein n=1 Tax=viral metagenome TaxID=1070528 RepID=A0A6C0KW80_9ZZZZ
MASGFFSVVGGGSGGGCMANEDEMWSLLSELRGDSPKLPEELELDCCEKCKGIQLIIDEGQNICLECNTVQSRIIDVTAEWRYYGIDDSRDGDPTRCGMPSNDLLPKSSLGSIIGGRKGDNRDMRRIRMYQMWNSMPYWERTLYNIFDKLTNNTTNHGIPSKVIEDAKVLYKKASEKKISRGDNKDGLIASCIYYACLINKLPRSPKEIARMFHIDPNVLTKGNARFQILLQINVDSSNPDDYITRFGSRLNMNYTDVQKCKEFAKKLDELEIVSENAPTSVAAGALFYYCTLNDLDFSKKQIADVCEVSEVTITKCYKRLLKYKDLFHPTNKI